MAIDAETAEPPVSEYTSPTSSGTPRSTSPAVASSEEVVPASSSATAATAAKPVRERIFAIPPWRGATRGSSATPAATRTRATLVSRPDTVTPPPAVTTSEAARPSPILTTEARPTPNEPRAIEARTTRVRNYVIPPWTGASRDNSSAAAAATATTTTPAAAAATTATPAPVSSPDAATPPPATAEAETTQPSPVTTTGALPTPEEIDALEAIMSWVRTYVIHPRTEASRGTTSTAPTATPAVCPDAATPPPASTESEPAAVSTTAVPTTLEEPSAMETLAARVRTYVIPPWAGASRDNSTTAAPATPPTEALATVTAAISPDTATPPPTPTESEAARLPPISTMDAPTTLEEPSAMETLAARVRTCVIPPWAGTSRNNSTTAAPATPPTAASATATVAISPDTATPLPATTASEAARPSPISTLDARSPTHEEPLAMDPRPARRRTYVIPPWAGASLNNSTTAAPATPSTPNVTTSTALVVTCPDTATPPPAYTASETAPPSPISTTDTRPTLEEEEEPRAMDPRPARLRTYVTPPWAGALRDNIAIAAAAAPTREAERELTRAEAQAIVDAADMAAAEEVVAANEAADALAIAQAVAESETAGTTADVGGRGGGRGGDGGRISLALHHRVRQARERASSTCSEQVRGSVRHEDMRLDPGWRTDGDVGRGRFSRARPGRVRIASSSSDQATERASDAETELSSGTLTELDERHAVLVQQDRVTLPRGRAASISSEQAALRASDDAEVDVDSGSQTEGDEGDGGRVLVAQERGRLSRGHGMRRLGNEPREHAKDDASSTLAVATESILRRRAQSCPPACERPPPPTAVAEPGDAGSGGEAGEQTSPNTQVASTQTDTEGEGSDSPAVEVADAQTGTEEEALEAPTAEVAEVQTEEEIEAATEAEAEAEAEAEDAGMALGGWGGTVFPIVREDPDTGAAAFRSSSCAECQSLIVDALAHRDAVGMKGKVSAGLNADRCRNCWRVVCDSCIGTCWPRTMVPRMYTRDSDSHRMRVCKTCHCAMEMFRKSLLLGRVEEAMAAYGTGCVNLDTPYTTYHGELPVHCAAAGGNVVLLSWLVDELGCSLFVDDDLKKPLRDLRDLTVLGAAAVNVQVQTMRYLVNTKRCSLHEITHLPTLKKALEACLHDSPETMLSLGASGSGPFGQLSSEIITDISLRADGERSSYVDRGGPIGVSAVFATASGFDDADDCCIVCFDNEVSCTLVPCGHHCCCRDCAARLKHCPVCRAGITEIIKAIPV